MKLIFNVVIKHKKIKYFLENICIKNDSFFLKFFLKITLISHNVEEWNDDLHFQAYFYSYLSNTRKLDIFIKNDYFLENFNVKTNREIYSFKFSITSS